MGSKSMKSAAGVRRSWGKLAGISIDRMAVPRRERAHRTNWRAVVLAYFAGVASAVVLIIVAMGAQ